MPGSDYEVEYSKEFLLGEGGFGDVYKGYNKFNRTAVAIKKIKHGKRLNDHEKRILESIEHKHIVRVIELLEENGITNRVVMEYCDGGSMIDYLYKPSNRYGMNENDACDFIGQFSAGLKFLIDHNVAHRDIKPHNIMRCLDGDASVIYKITDFGLSKQLSYMDESMTTLAGTKPYAHPKVLDHSRYHADEADLWSTGVMIYQMMTGKLPFSKISISKILSKPETAISCDMCDRGPKYATALPKDCKVSCSVTHHIFERILTKLFNLKSPPSFDSYFELVEDLQNEIRKKRPGFLYINNGIEHMDPSKWFQLNCNKLDFIITSETFKNICNLSMDSITQREPYPRYPYPDSKYKLEQSLCYKMIWQCQRLRLHLKNWEKVHNLFNEKDLIHIQDKRTQFDPLLKTIGILKNSAANMVKISSKKATLGRLSGIEKSIQDHITLLSNTANEIGLFAGDQFCNSLERICTECEKIYNEFTQFDLREDRGGDTAPIDQSTVNLESLKKELEVLFEEVTKLELDTKIADHFLSKNKVNDDDIVESLSNELQELCIEQQLLREDEQCKKGKEVDMIKNEEICSEDLEQSLTQSLQRIGILEQEKEQMRVAQQELEDVVKELTDKIQRDSKNAVNAEVLQELQGKNEKLVLENTSYKEKLSKCKAELLETADLQRSVSSEIRKLESAVKGKDAIIRNLTTRNQKAEERLQTAKSNEGKLSTLTKENEKYCDDYKQLNDDMAEVLRKYRESEHKLSEEDAKIRKLEGDLAYMRQLNHDMSKADVTNLQECTKCKAGLVPTESSQRSESSEMRKLQAAVKGKDAIIRNLTNRNQIAEGKLKTAKSNVGKVHSKQTSSQTLLLWRPNSMSMPLHILDDPASSLQSLGRGSFGTVYLYKDAAHQIAIKLIKIPGIKRVPKEGVDVFQDVEHHKNLSHPNIIQYYGSHQAVDHICIMIEYAENGSLKDCLRKSGRLNDEQIIPFAKQILEGLNYLHTQTEPVIHRDLRSPNVLLCSKGTVKIADFGISNQLTILTSTSEFNTEIRNVFWHAPEMIEHTKSKGKLGTKIDIWSLGITILEMAHVIPPFFNLTDSQYMHRLCVKKDLPEIPAFVNHKIRDLLGHCLVYDDKKRKNATDILSLIYGQ